MRKITENINKSEQIIKSNRNKWNGNVLLPVPDDGISKIYSETLQYKSDIIITPK